MVNAPNDRSRGRGAEDVLHHQHRGSVVTDGHQPEDVDLLGQQLVAQGNH
jgi:hypothetical protein